MVRPSVSVGWIASCDETTLLLRPAANSPTVLGNTDVDRFEGHVWVRDRETQGAAWACFVGGIAVRRAPRRISKHFIASESVVACRHIEVEQAFVAQLDQHRYSNMQTKSTPPCL
jgi:hypothetical protein